MGDQQLILEKENHVAIIRINRPEKLNSITIDMSKQLVDMAKEINHDNNIRAVVLTGTGEKAFCAGSDIKELDLYESPWEYRNKEYEYARTIKSIRKPVIAAVKGYALGGGLELAVMADIRIGADTSAYGAPEVNWGWLGGGGNSQMLPRLIGPSKASELLLTGKTIQADEAYRIGLIDHMYPADQVEQKAMELAETIAEKAPIATQVIKHAVRMSMNTGLDIGLNYENELVHITFSTEDKQEGVAAFKEKRKPEFKGK